MFYENLLASHFFAADPSEAGRSHPVAMLPCRANETENCVELLYPPIPTTAKGQAIAELDKFEEVESGTSNVQIILSHSPSELLPTKNGHGAHLRTDDRSKEFRHTVSVPENGIYYLLVDYHSWERTAMPVRVRVQQTDITADGILLVKHCPYAFFCREMLSTGGRAAATLRLQKSPPATTVTLQVQPGREFSIGAVTLVKEEQWHNDLLGQKAHCVRKNGVCVAQHFQPPNSIRTEAEKSGNVNSSIAGDKLPFQVAGEPSQLCVMALDEVQITLYIEGVVASPDNYVFVVHYFSPNNPPIVVDVFVQNERFGDALFHYCPSMSGCRTIV
uniref:Calpain_III domain-containing protein n=1 Tax=Globodera pallida TaxID=36090 RepID=A0A183CHS2_GLOPA